MMNGKVVEYNGERTLAGMSKFLETGGSYGQAAPDEVTRAFLTNENRARHGTKSLSSLRYHQKKEIRTR